MTIDRTTIEGLQEVVKKAIPVQFTLQNSLLKASPGYGPWLRPQNARAISVSKQEREIRSEAPIYVRSISVFGEEVDRLASGLSIDAIAINGDRTRLKFTRAKFTRADSTAGYFLRADVSMMCSGFSLRSTSSIRSLKISSIGVYGYSLEQFDAQSARISQTLAISADVDAYVAKVQSSVKSAEEKLVTLDSRQGELSAEIESLQRIREELDDHIEGAESNLAELEAQLEKVNGSLGLATTALNEARNNEAQLQGAVNGLNEKIAEQKGRLQALVNDRSLISDEYKDYVEEGKVQSRSYVLLSAAIVAVMGFCAWQLYSGADRILSSSGLSPADLVGQVIQRAPFAAAIAVIVGVCWKLLAVLVGRVMKIHSDRLTLARLLVIAKDTVYSSAANLKVSDQERFKERIRLKLAMLKGHLAADLGHEFVFEPERNPAGVEQVAPEAGSGDASREPVA